MCVQDGIRILNFGLEQLFIFKTYIEINWTFL